LESDAEFGRVEPYYLAGLTPVVQHDKLKRVGDSIGCLHVQTRPYFREIPDGAWDTPTAEHNLPGLKHPHTGRFAAVVHGHCP
jgi:hypothetical protein